MAASNTLEGLIDSFLAEYGGVEPFRTWFQATASDDLTDEYPSIELAKNTIFADISSAQEFSAIIQALEKWGITTYTDFRDIRVTPQSLGATVLIQVRPLFPVFILRGGHVYPPVDLVTASFNAQGGLANVAVNQVSATPAPPEEFDANNFNLDTQDYANRPGLWRTRQIESSQRNFIIGTQQLFSTGTAEPVIYSNELAAPYARYDNELIRWRLQNESILSTLIIPYQDAASASPDSAFHPHQILSLPTSGLTSGIGGEEQWRVISAKHRWRGGAYSQELRVALWQGPFVRVS